MFKKLLNDAYIALLYLIACLIFSHSVFAFDYVVEEKASLKYQSIPDITVSLKGPMEQRVENNVVDWVLRAPKANPILLSVFKLRDREPKSNEYYVPWVGEFIGKFLTNSIQSLHMSGNPELEKTVKILIEELMAQQDEDGYLGPFPKQDRLLTAWDLWGHYHAITALLMWYERTGDQTALDCCRRMGDFICDTFLDTGKRMKDVGSHEMNLSIITSLLQLYRVTGKERYFAMAKEVEKDWEDTGDYYRSGLTGIEFFRTPRPRWESIHCILGLTELYQITGNENYRKAFMSLWYSTRKREMHNNGSFSSHEAAVGHPYDKGAIETCCTIAWMAMTVEALRLSGEPACADALEISTFNAATSFQHPSGSWSTYDTPMNGRRQSSFHSIVFQSRPGSPELNCCSVNAPRGIGMITEWGLMKGRDAAGKTEMVVNYYGPGTMVFDVDGNKVTMVQKTEYPRDGKITIEVNPEKTQNFTMKFRIPGWAEEAAVTEPDRSAGKKVATGEYYTLTRDWKKGDVVLLDFPMTLRYETGDLDYRDTMSVFRGPLLLAYDQRYNEFEEEEIPVLTPAQLKNAKVEIPKPDHRGECFGCYTPWILVTLMAGEDDKTPLVLSDFASAGLLGTTYASWLPAKEVVPPIPACDYPPHDGKVAPGVIRFSWRRMANPKQYQYKVVVSDTPDFQKTLIAQTADNPRYLVMDETMTKTLVPGKEYYWKMVAENKVGKTESLAPGRSFTIDTSLPPVDMAQFEAPVSGVGPNRLLISDDLAGKAAPTVGVLKGIEGTITPAPGADGNENSSVRFDGQDGLAVYKLDEFPRTDFTVTLDFCVNQLPLGQRHAHVVCAWAKGGDDPIRVFVNPEGGLVGAVEGSRGGATHPVGIRLNTWYKLHVVKDGSIWRMYLNGTLAGQFAVTEESLTTSTEIALGGNPLYRNTPEWLACQLADFRMYATALYPDEMQ